MLWVNLGKHEKTERLNIMTMDEIVAKLRSLTTKDDRLKFLADLSTDQRKQFEVFHANKVTDEPPKISFDPRGVTVEWSTGLSASFYKDGRIQWVWNDKVLDADEIASLQTANAFPPDILQLCFQHIAQSHIEDNKQIRDKMSQDNLNKEGKTRFVHTSNKKAFVAGMILGKREALR